MLKNIETEPQPDNRIVDLIHEKISRIKDVEPINMEGADLGYAYKYGGETVWMRESPDGKRAYLFIGGMDYPEDGEEIMPDDSDAVIVEKLKSVVAPYPLQ